MKKLEAEQLLISAVFDNEEVGSLTKQGADSTFLEEFLEIVLENIYPDKNRLCKRSFYQNSFLLSADNGHAVHPNHPEKTDPTNRPYLNGGIAMLVPDPGKNSIALSYRQNV